MIIVDKGKCRSQNMCVLGHCLGFTPLSSLTTSSQPCAVACTQGDASPFLGGMRQREQRRKQNIQAQERIPRMGMWDLHAGWNSAGVPAPRTSCLDSCTHETPYFSQPFTDLHFPGFWLISGARKRRKRWEFLRPVNIEVYSFSGIQRGN